MKRKLFILGIVSAFALAGCDIFDYNRDGTLPDGGTTPGGETRINHNFYGGVVSSDGHIGYEFSKSQKAISKPKSGVGSINIYAFNDFHGAVLEQSEGEYGAEPGLKILGNFFKAKSQEENTLILDQGDTWQGSFESNYQNGAIVQDVFNYAGVSLRTAGNHDFDWGLSQLERTNNRTFNDNYIPCLSANLYDYSNGENGTNQQSRYGKEYATFILNNGVKVGVIGVIGKSQITSIMSQHVDSVCFTDHIDKVKSLSDYLRIEKDCDIIIASAHESPAYMLNQGLTDESPISRSRYVDLVLGGHSHYEQNYLENGVKFVQWDANGASTGLVTLKYDFATQSLVDGDTEVNTYYPNYYKAHYSTIDPTISSMVDTYINSTQSVASEVLSEHFEGSFDTSSLARVMSEAVYARVSKTVDIDFAVCNYARSEFSSSTMTYSDLYKSFPFDNQIILVDVNSQYSFNNISWNFSFREDTELTPTLGNTYKCAVLDYLAMHTNEERNYDRFPEVSEGYSVFNDTDGDEAPTYRDILCDYLRANPSKVFNASNYQSSNPHYVQ